MNIERRFSEFRADDDGGGLSGTLLRYGDTAKVYDNITETIQAGAFGEIDESRFRLNLMHDRAQPISFADSENLQLINDDKALDVRLKWPDNRWADDAKRGVSSGVLRGLSVEFQVKRNGFVWDDKGHHVTIRDAKLLGAGIVDIPAYPDSRLHRFNIPLPQRTGVFPLENQRAPRRLKGLLPFGKTSVVSMQSRRAVRFLPGSLDITTMPVTLLHGSFQSPLAATGADSLKLSVAARGLEWVANKIVNTSAGNDLTRLLRAKLITGFTAGYVADPEDVTTREIEIGGLKFREDIVERALLCDIKLISSGAGGAGNVSQRSYDWLI